MTKKYFILALLLFFPPEYLNSVDQGLASIKKMIMTEILIMGLKLAGAIVLFSIFVFTMFQFVLLMHAQYLKFQYWPRLEMSVLLAIILFCITIPTIYFASRYVKKQRSQELTQQLSKNPMGNPLLDINVQQFTASFMKGLLEGMSQEKSFQKHDTPRHQ